MTAVFYHTHGRTDTTLAHSHTHGRQTDIYWFCFPIVCFGLLIKTIYSASLEISFNVLSLRLVNYIIVNVFVCVCLVDELR